MFIAALFIIARIWKQPRCPSEDEWIRKLWYIYTMEYCSAIKENSFESVLMWWMKLEPIIQSEVSQKEKQQYSILPGAIIGDPTHDEVMKKIPDPQGHSGSHPWQGHEEKTWHARPFRIQGTLQVGLSLYSTLCPPPFSAVVHPAADSCVACLEFSCSSFTE